MRTTKVWLWAALGWIGCADRVDVVAFDLDVDGTADAATPIEPCVHATAAGVTQQGERSLADLAAETRARALCTCGDLSASGGVHVESGAVAVNGSMQLSAAASIAGPLSVAGAGGVTLGSHVLEVGDDLAVAGPLLGSDASVEVDGDAWLAGPVELAALRVNGRLRLAPGASVTVSEGAPSAVAGEATVDALCGCDDGFRLSPEAVRELAEATADSALDALPSDCGGVIASADQLGDSLRAEDDALLVVEGDLRIAGPLGLDVAAGHALDLVVTGNVSVDGPLRLGSLEGGQVRLFVLGGGTLQLSEGGDVFGLIHAPDAELVVPAPLRVEGSVIVRRVAAAAALTLARR